MAIAVTHLARIGIICLSILPRLVVEEGKTLIAGITLRVVSTLTNGINAAATSTGVTVAGTPVDEDQIYSNELCNSSNYLAATVISRML